MDMGMGRDDKLALKSVLSSIQKHAQAYVTQIHPMHQQEYPPILSNVPQIASCVTPFSSQRCQTAVHVHQISSHAKAEKKNSIGKSAVCPRGGRCIRWGRCTEWASRCSAFVDLPVAIALLLNQTELQCLPVLRQVACRKWAPTLLVHL